MKFSPLNGKVSVSPKLWYVLSDDALRDAEVLFLQERELGTLRMCHSSLEKLLKGVCAERSLLNDEDDSHNLLWLSQRAGVLEQVPIKMTAPEGKKEPVSHEL